MLGKNRGTSGYKSRIAALGLMILLMAAGTPRANSAAAPPGQTLAIEINAPAAGTTVGLHEAFTISGRAALDALTAATNVLYAVDVSGSTTVKEVQGQDCDGDDTAGNTSDDFNRDGSVGDTLDCEISGVLALNTSLAGLSGVKAGLVVFGSSAARADVDPARGDQPFTSPLHIDKNTNGMPDLEEVTRSLKQGTVELFQKKPVGPNTNFDQALAMVNTAFATQPPGSSNVVFFLSDGKKGSVSQQAQSPLAVARAAGTVVHTFAVGKNASGCGPSDALGIIAATTGGRCQKITNPSALRTVLPRVKPRGIDRVEVSVNNGQPIPASLDALGNWSATIPAGTIVAGANRIKATVFAGNDTSVVVKTFVGKNSSRFLWLAGFIGALAAVLLGGLVFVVKKVWAQSGAQPHRNPQPDSHSLRVEPHLDPGEQTIEMGETWPAGSPFSVHLQLDRGVQDIDHSATSYKEESPCRLRR